MKVRDGKREREIVRLSENSAKMGRCVRERGEKKREEEKRKRGGEAESRR
jgi:hypothetical protein